MNKIMIYAIEAEWKIKQHALTGIILDFILPRTVLIIVYKSCSMIHAGFYEDFNFELETSVAKYSCRMRKISSAPPGDKI